jgi:exodeoxyribonuclease VII large subunit
MNEFDWDQTDIIPQKEVYSVSRLNSEVRALLEGSFPLLWVEGEISNLARPSSGHLYFSLKDSKAQVRCAMFRNRNQLLRFRPDNGMQVLIRARVGLYEGRGEFQLVAEHMEESGDGALRRAYEELKQKLEHEGLFDTSVKKPIPSLPRAIGIITSPSGAAIRDVLSVLKRRFPTLPVIIYPTAVQGDNAAREMVEMIRLAEQRQECDVLLITRGGGSLEDLWAFNEEILARAIHDCQLPVVSAVGHEIDFTIADFVADYRAPTPSAAAEHLSPDQGEWLDMLLQKLRILQKSSQHHLQQSRQQLQHLNTRLMQLHPGVQLKQWSQRIDELEMRYQLSVQHQLDKKRFRLERTSSHLMQHTPANRLTQLQQRQEQLWHRLQQTMNGKIGNSKLSLSTLTRALDSISPLATLDRGYSILLKEDSTIIRDQKQVQEGEQVTARLAKGHLKLRVQEKN